MKKNKTVDARALPWDSEEQPALSYSGHRQDAAWIPVVSTSVPFPVEIFHQVCEAIVLHPEWSSSSIIRCDILADTQDGSNDAPAYPGYHVNKSIRRKIVPRKPSDGILVQDCHFYDSVDGEDGGLLVMMPHLSSRSPDAVPFYHPQVAGLAFRYFSVYNEDYEKKSAEEAGLGIVQVDYLPLEIVDFAALPPGRPYWSQDSRTYRTALQLLSLLVKHGKAESAGASYVKRVHHDKIVPREVFQDLYVRLKEKYLWILQEWKESTDPLKHVFEDVAIASFLICLWQILYRENEGHPPGGFVDVGCGNGLLVYILYKEGYEGYGLDIRARRSWSLWGSDVPLLTTTLSPPELCLSKSPPFPQGSFLIGNHADELTPWIPLLASLVPDSSFLNMPCCMHTFDARYTSQEHSINPDIFISLPEQVKEDMIIFDNMSSVKGGRYAAYINYIAEITINSGWRPEREALRVPSTKNWAFVGRKRIWSGHAEEVEKEKEIRQWIEGIARESMRTWKPRPVEGKDH